MGVKKKKFFLFVLNFNPPFIFSQRSVIPITIGFSPGIWKETGGGFQDFWSYPTEMLTCYPPSLDSATPRLHNFHFRAILFNK